MIRITVSGPRGDVHEMAHRISLAEDIAGRTVKKYEESSAPAVVPFGIDTVIIICEEQK